MSTLPAGLPAGLPPEAVALREICRAASAIILQHYAAAAAAETKKDGSPVTAADRDAEACILPRLQALAPGVPAVAEEQQSAGLGPAEAGARFWLVDPLDGTRHFVGRTGQFTINIALVEDGRPVLGILCQPVGGACYIGVLPPLAPAPLALRWDLDAEAPSAPLQASAPAAGTALRLIRSHDSGDLQALDRYLRQLEIASAAPLGSALKFAHLAAGSFDLYPRFGQSTMEWDTAAGQAILEAAGGQVLGTDGQPLRYGKPGFRNDAFIASGAIPAERLRLPVQPDGNAPAGPPAAPRRTAPVPARG